MWKVQTYACCQILSIVRVSNSQKTPSPRCRRPSSIRTSASATRCGLKHWRTARTPKRRCSTPSNCRANWTMRLTTGWCSRANITPSTRTISQWRRITPTAGSTRARAICMWSVAPSHPKSCSSGCQNSCPRAPSRARASSCIRPTLWATAPRMPPSSRITG